MSQFQKFEAGMPMSIPPHIDSFPIKGNTSLPKGTVCVVDDAGYLVIATTANSAKRKHYVNIKAVDNTGGADGAKAVPVVGANQRVTVQTKSVLHPGDAVKVASVNGTVTAFNHGIDDDNLKIGHYIGIEPGVYEKDSASPYAERFTANSNPEVFAAVDDIVVIELL